MAPGTHKVVELGWNGSNLHCLCHPPVAAAANRGTVPAVVPYRVVCKDRLVRAKLTEKWTTR